MGQRRGRAANGREEGDERTGSALPEPQVESLRRRFERFRRTHKPRTRYPQALRTAVLAALRSGVAELELRRACGLSAAQINAWRRHEEMEAQPGEVNRPPARVFSVVDEIHLGMSDEPAINPAGQEVELRVGGWAVQIRRLDG